MFSNMARITCLIFISLSLSYTCAEELDSVLATKEFPESDEDIDLGYENPLYLEDEEELLFSEADDSDSGTSPITSPYEDTDEDNGGPSSEFRPLDFDWTKEINKNVLTKRGVDTDCLSRKRSAGADEVTAAKLCAQEAKFFSKMPRVLDDYKKALKKTLKVARLQGIITGRIKSLSSLVGKMQKDGVTDVRQITDIVGLRVTLQTNSDIRRFKRAFIKLYNSNITSIRCYGTCGPDVGNRNKKRLKRYWPWKGSGYRRLHFKVSVPSLKTMAEIQVGTPYMTLWAEWEHAVIYKGPKKLSRNKRARAYAQKMAQYFSMLDNIRDKMMARCPKILRRTKARDIFSERDWKVFGKPDNACVFWNDLKIDMP